MSPPRTPSALTVVIAASRSAGAVIRTVESLGPVCADVEVIVSAPVRVLPPSSSLPAGVVLVPAGDGLGVPALRRLGLDAAGGGVVAFTEDSCLLSAGWIGAWLRAFGDPSVLAATGPVVPIMGDRPLDLAVFFCEYAPFLPGPPPARLAGNNFAIRRVVARELDPATVHESEVPHHPFLAAGAVAGHVARYRPTEAIRDRLRFGHDYGRRRSSTLPLFLRLTGLLIGPAVLLAQVTRLSLTLARRPRQAGPLLDALPITLGLLTAWSVGEWLGWIRSAWSTPDLPASRRPHEKADRPPSRPTAPGPSTPTSYRVSPANV